MQENQLPRLAVMLAFAGLFFATSAAAEPVVMVGEPPTEQKFVFDSDAKVYNFNVDFTVESIHIHLDKKPTKIETRDGYQGAISGDAPGWDIKGALEDTPWHEIPAVTDLPAEEDPNTDDVASKISIPWDPAWVLPANVDVTAWKSIFEQCRAAGRIGGVNNDSPCYMYRDRVEYRLWMNPTDEPIVLRLTFPGGI